MGAGAGIESVSTIKVLEVAAEREIHIYNYKETTVSTTKLKLH